MARAVCSGVAFKAYCVWFLKMVLDHIVFSTKLFDLTGLERRHRRLIDDVVDDRRAPAVAALRRGELERGRTRITLGNSGRTVRNTLKAFADADFLTSASPKTPVRPAFPLAYRERLFPNLFADIGLSD